MYKTQEIKSYSKQSNRQHYDAIAIEEPLQIILRNDQGEKISFAITMRTPGHDEELVLGQLYSENIISNLKQIRQIDSKGAIGQSITVVLTPEVRLDKLKSNRHIINHGGCGVCGKTSLDFMDKESPYIHRPHFPKVHPGLLHQMVSQIQSSQGTFQKTGGVHAAALFDSNGQLQVVREDIGRHNAMDKIVGWALKTNSLPLKDSMILFSGRTSFELIQKANEAGIAIVASIGAPSSLAIDLAEENGITLVGFLKPTSFNLYNDLNRMNDEQG